MQPLTGWQRDEEPLRFNLDFPESPTCVGSPGQTVRGQHGGEVPRGEAVANSSDICQRGEAKIEK